MISDREISALPARLQPIARGVRRLDFTVLRDGGEALVFAHAERLGISAAALLDEWSEGVAELRRRSGSRSVAATPTGADQDDDEVADVDEVGDDSDDSDTEYMRGCWCGCAACRNDNCQDCDPDGCTDPDHCGHDSDEEDEEDDD